MMLTRVLGPGVASSAAIIAGLVFFDQAHLPDLFPWSTAVIPAVLTGALAVGLGLMLPDRLYHTRAERLALDLESATGLTGAASERVLSHVAEARRQAAILRASAASMRADVADATHAAAHDLDALADRLMKDPQSSGAAIKLIARARLVVEAVETFTAFKADRGAADADIEVSRQQVIQSLMQMSGAADAVHSQLARIKLTEIEVATEVADGLLRRHDK